MTFRSSVYRQTLRNFSVNLHNMNWSLVPLEEFNHNYLAFLGFKVFSLALPQVKP